MNSLQNLSPNDKSNITKVAVGGVLLGTTTYVLYNFVRTKKYYGLIKKKKVDTTSKKAELLKYLDDLKKPIETMDTITNVRLCDLIAGLEAGAYKPSDVLRAYQAKALIMDKEYNFIADLNTFAEQDAIDCEHSKRSNLRGIPVSVKDCFFIKGSDTTLGMPDRIDKPSEIDSVIVRTLRLQGAIPFVMTNMCQTGKSIESSNPIFGETVNPYDKTRTAGGSSGGEGAILSCGASLIGLGSDIGGSIRIPAHYCGVFGLKPTSMRFSQRHTPLLYASQNMIQVSIGPMARRIDDLVTFFKALACGDLYHLDPYCPPLCFNDKIFEKKRPLRIGCYVHIGGSQVEPIPAVKRAVVLAKKALLASGHSVSDFEIPDIDYAMQQLFFRIIFCDGGTGFINDLIGYNPVDPSLRLTYNMLRLPNALKTLGSYFVYPFHKNYSYGLAAMSGTRSVNGVWKLRQELLDYREKVLSKWHSEKLDGIICPVLPVVAPLLRTSHLIMDIISYTAIYNVLDYPAGSVPVTKVTAADVTELEASYPTDTPTHRKIRIQQKETVGMPVGVQCVSLMWREETCLRMMRDVSEHLE